MLFLNGLYGGAAARPAALRDVRHLLSGSQPTQIVAHQQPSVSNFINDGVTASLPYPTSFLRDAQLPFTTLLKAAWAAVLGEMSGEEDVVFGAVATGRQGLGAGEGVFMPATSIIPVRIELAERFFEAMSLLRDVHEEEVAAASYEHLGHTTAVQACTDWPAWTRFPSVVEHINTGNPNFPHETFVLQGEEGVKVDVGMIDTTADIADLWVVTKPPPTPDAPMSAGIYFCNTHIPHATAQTFLDRLVHWLSVLSRPTGSSAPTLSLDGTRILPLPLVEAADAGARKDAAAAAGGAANRLVVKAWDAVLAPHGVGADEMDLVTPWWSLRGAKDDAGGAQGIGGVAEVAAMLAVALEQGGLGEGGLSVVEVVEAAGMGGMGVLMEGKVGGVRVVEGVEG
ncbi:hypothetical protein EDC01DRAFT_726709 [Geopyxis carbonaria]|nr:hypothetical protein EDC01DRAFT_726709 [Geopyxis carbonaria]